MAQNSGRPITVTYKGQMLVPPAELSVKEVDDSRAARRLAMEHLMSKDSTVAKLLIVRSARPAGRPTRRSLV